MLDRLDTAPFRWEDGERVIRFGRGTAAEAADLLGRGYVLLTTPRAAAAPSAAAVVAGAAAIRHVPSGLVDEVAARVADEVAGTELVALGGGRVIDVAKAVAAARPGSRVAAVPTTLSGAEMTRTHRHARGVAPDTPRVRPTLVLNDPVLSASQPEPAIAASALNALGHAVEAPCTPWTNPVATLAAHAAARLLVGAWERPSPNREALALGALLAGYTIDSARYGLHHVLAQTLVRVAGAEHGAANAAMLPHTLGALSWRFPRQMEALAAALGTDPAAAAARLAARAGAAQLRDIGVAVDALAACADAAARRTELDHTPPRADRAEVLMLYEQAW